MVEPEVEKDGVKKEKESEPNIRVTFCGYNHYELNLQSVNRIREAFQTFLQAPGRKVLYLEAGDIDQELAEKAKERAKKVGILRVFADPFLAKELGRWPTEDETKERFERISTSDLETIINENLIPHKELQFYFILKQLDELRGRRDFDIEFEWHSKALLEKQDILLEKWRAFRDLALREWRRGNFDRSLENYKRYMELFSRSWQERDKESVRFLKKEVEDLTAEREGGGIFLIFGETHLPIIEELEQELQSNTSVKFNSLGVISENAPEHLFQISLRRGLPAQDVLYARSFLQEKMLDDLFFYSSLYGDISSVANNFETIYSTIGDVASSFSLEEIKGICKRKEKLVDILKNHPSAGPIKKYNEIYP